MGLGALFLTYFEQIVTVAIIAAVVLFFLSGVEIVLLMWESRAVYLRAEGDKIKALALLDVNQWNAIGIAIPTIRKVWQGLPLQLWGDTCATVDQMHFFVETSNIETTSPERNWNTAEHPRRAWVELYGWLVRAGYIIPDSAAGNRSFKFYPGKFRKLQSVALREKGIENPIPRYIGNERAEVYHAEVQNLPPTG